ncbi:NHLP leader peptide family natural product precursor [Paenibacillus dendritiformis]|uniref:NHLP leader peptide family RiPP precursor n=1 Tax=Paenibacillus dendritiformis TaxID=130049 RepID=UPI0010593115|nr:NHLP leader peptide family RiPP precursor [Paenibacillus dendritiformis]TDL48813.1 NHLP leader peptide family natural product precursor [Paenibacillus dendritiformis]
MSINQMHMNQIVQRAWEDATFKEKLLADPKSAIKELLDISIPEHIQLTTVEEKLNHYVLILPPNPSEVVKDTPAAKRDMWY